MNIDWFQFEAHWDANIAGIPKRDWGKRLAMEYDITRKVKGKFKTDTLRVYTVKPQAHLIATTMPVGLLAGYSPDAVLVKAFEKNYKTPAKPGVVSNYGFEQQHAEPIELLDYVYETIFDRATEAEINRYRHNSKNYESGRYVDYIKHGVTVVIPMEPDILESEIMQAEWAYDVVIPAFKSYAKYLDLGWKKQHARRALGTYLAIEGVIKVNLRSLWHMARQRSAELSPNGREAEPEIGEIVTQMVYEALPYLPNFAEDLLEQISRGYR
jgi:thymidylate synthase ThyX